MTVSRLYHRGNRELQTRFDSQRIADRLDETRRHETFSETDREIIESASFFFLATADHSGHPDCSFKGGDPGFVRVRAGNVLEFPDYDGNGMFKSLGNILVNPSVGMLFLEFRGGRRRLRVNGTATVIDLTNGTDSDPGAKLLVRVTAEHIFPNCPRYIPHMEIIEPSVYVPRPGYAPPDPLWKSKPDLLDYLPRRDRTLGGTHD